jgi:hypothetical protein
MMLAVVVRVVVAYSCDQWSMVSVLKTGFDNPVVWAKGPEEGKLQESGFNSIRLQLKLA